MFAQVFPGKRLPQTTYLDEHRHAECGSVNLRNNLKEKLNPPLLQRAKLLELLASSCSGWKKTKATVADPGGTNTE